MHDSRTHGLWTVQLNQATRKILKKHIGACDQTSGMCSHIQEKIRMVKGSNKYVMNTGNTTAAQSSAGSPPLPVLINFDIIFETVFSAVCVCVCVCFLLQLIKAAFSQGT